MRPTKYKMNKRAIFDVTRKMIYWMIAIVMIIMITLVFTVLIFNYTSSLTHVPAELKGEIIALRFTNLPECFAFQDKISGRVIPDTIDLQKFTDEHQAQSCYKTGEETGRREFNFRLQLVNRDVFVDTNKYANVPKFIFEKRVLVWNGQDFVPDTLKIFVQNTILFTPGATQ